MDVATSPLGNLSTEANPPSFEYFFPLPRLKQKERKIYSFYTRLKGGVTTLARISIEFLGFFYHGEGGEGCSFDESLSFLSLLTGKVIGFSFLSYTNFAGLIL